jgi:hypothetical protein
MVGGYITVRSEAAPGGDRSGRTRGTLCDRRNPHKSCKPRSMVRSLDAPLCQDMLGDGEPGAALLAVGERVLSS